MRKTTEVIDDIKELVCTKGYIYALCMILFEDFHVNLEKIHEINVRERLSTKEASLLLGFLIQDTIDFSLPKSPEELMGLKKRTYELMEELHDSFGIIFFEKLKESLKVGHEIENWQTEKKDFFGKGDMLIEPIFYSGSGVYDFQYLVFLSKKYEYDEDWLIEKRDFHIAEVSKIVLEIKRIFQEKSKKVHLYGLKERLPEIIEKMQRKKPKENWEKHAKDTLPLMELHQYVGLFFEYAQMKGDFSIENIREEGWKSFYKALIELFIIRKSDFKENAYFNNFLKAFSLFPSKNLNSKFQTIGDYNLINSNPLIQLDSERYFVPIVFLLFEAIYESPFYWMMEDEKYTSRAGENRGKVGEEITFDFLSKIFGINRTFKSIRVIHKKGQDNTDIDVLCILGSKALCVQVKSKKLTELSRKGNDEALNKDFKGAVQDAYKQGLICRQKVLEKEVKFIDKDGNNVQFSEKIDEVYIMVVTTENYPSLTHQAHVMLDKKDSDPFPLVLTIFDLELLAHYLNDPYDFLYYVKQRITLMDYFKADEEIVFLGYHLDQKLWKSPKVDNFIIDNSFAQLIDRNYYPLKAGIKVTDEGDAIKNRWKNEKFEQLCNELKNLEEPRVTDILFYLFDWSGDARDNLVNFIISTKEKTLRDGKVHNFSIPPDYNYSPRMGVTYISLNCDDTEELRNRLLSLSRARKYTSKGDVWIGFGSLKNSPNIIDCVAFNDQLWEYDEYLEKESKFLLEGKNRGTFIRLGRKIGRNEKCRCGSRIKYKKCCERNERV